MYYNDLTLIGREKPLFDADYMGAFETMQDMFDGARVLVVGGAGSIGSEVVKLLTRFPVEALTVVDISENNLTELTRDFRSSIGYITAETSFEPLDAASPIFGSFLAAQKPYDIILNFSAMKHVRSEKDPWALMRMIDTNIFIAKHLLDYADRVGAKKYFCVSTDKAQNPANLMGATKRVMECYLSHGGWRQGTTPVSTARFANVAFSDGSLLHGFTRRLEKRQPLSAPNDILRYFVTGREAGMLCMMSIATGGDQEIFFPKLDAHTETESFDKIAVKYLKSMGYEAHICSSEDEAREMLAHANDEITKWPCYFFESDTTGEKPLEEFYGAGDAVNWDRHQDIGVISGLPATDEHTLGAFEKGVAAMKAAGVWDKPALVELIESALPGFAHEEKGKYLDGRM